MADQNEKNEKWVEVVGGFATLIGKTLEEVEKALADVVGEPGDRALAVLADESVSIYDEIKAAFDKAGLKVPSLILRQSVESLRGPKPVVEEREMGQHAPMANILPTVLDQQSFISALKTTGELKEGIELLDIQSAIMAAHAKKYGFYDLPAKIHDKMNDYSKKMRRPNSPSYYEVRNMVTRKRYADVLSPFKLDGNFITQARTDALFERIDQYLWPALQSFKLRIDEWFEAYYKTAQTQFMTGMAMAQAAQVVGINSGMNQQAMQMAMMSDMSSIKDFSESVAESINMVFAGDSIPVARGLAYESDRIQELLKDPKLPGLLGVGGYEEMIQILEVPDVTSDVRRTEQDLVIFTFSILKFKEQPVNMDILYLMSMIQIAARIPFEKLMRREDVNTTKKPSRF